MLPNRPVSVPPALEVRAKAANGKHTEPLNSLEPPNRPSSTQAVTMPSSTSLPITPPSGTPSPPSLSLLPSLDHALPSVVNSRSGSVLARGFILKTDHYPSGRALDLAVNVHGAPNFRVGGGGEWAELNVYGVAQPRTQGLRAILSILRAAPGQAPSAPDAPSRVVWFSTREEPVLYISGRPFVLRDAAAPRRTLTLSDRAANLEAIELRMKADVLAEASRGGGVVLTHNEIASESPSGTGAIVPTWTFVDVSNVKTSRELWGEMKAAGWSVDYHRIPIAPDRPIEDSNYLDAYLRVIRTCDPRSTSLVFSCGMGAVRTTFAMVAAAVMRKRQLALLENRISSTTPTDDLDARRTAALEQAIAQQDLNRSLLRLTHLLQQASTTTRAIELLLAYPTLLDNLRKAHMGNYGIVLSLLGCLEHGPAAKRLVDKVIDVMDQVTHLREDILVHRLRHALRSGGEGQEVDSLGKAGRALEKYFFLIAFAAFLEEQPDDLGGSFGDWVKGRIEISNQIKFLRKSTDSKLNVFAPINDLSVLSKRHGELDRAMVPGRKNDLAISGGQILGDEYASHVVSNRGGIVLRQGTILKSDQWHTADASAIRGAPNFRKVPHASAIYALGQPTLSAIHDVVHAASPQSRVVWITLREEPIVYVNGSPYCLRREGRFSLRNMKDYGGISAGRLEMLEERLRDDILAEIRAFGGRLLLHTESAAGTILPVWEDIADPAQDVLVLKDIMARAHPGISYHRIPITAERPPDPADLQDILDVVLGVSPETPIVVNCQLGRGRSTLASIIVMLVRDWLASYRVLQTPTTPLFPAAAADDAAARPRHSYQVINNLLRVLRAGLRIKACVDGAIDRADQVVNLRLAIEECRIRADEASADESESRAWAQRGLQNLHRYFSLLVFQAYLQSAQPDTLARGGVQRFVESLPVLRTFESELFTAPSAHTLTPLSPPGGLAHPDEVAALVASRAGGVLSAATILKDDMFLGLQKLTLVERIQGAPNFRTVPLVLGSVDARMVCGSGMPTVEGLHNVLTRLDAGPGAGKRVFWTSLREEPVVYIAGRPYVLRLATNPLENVEATGVTTSMVERMEETFKADVLREVRSSRLLQSPPAALGRILVHDEIELDHPGSFAVVPQWKDVAESEVLTPRDVFERMQQEGYGIDYGRVAVTDEQAPLPDALSQLHARVSQALEADGELVFNCQMGRGRTTTGMVAACLVASVSAGTFAAGAAVDPADPASSGASGGWDAMDGPSEEEVYQQRGEYKMILQLVGVLEHGLVAKQLADRAIDAMQDVQNLRRAIYDYKLKLATQPPDSPAAKKLYAVTTNYLFRYGTLIVFANFLVGQQHGEPRRSFSEWLKEHREVGGVLRRRGLD
ncbi:unnamed protein product [Mycena citricolor]|uniref:Inositol hexakisphosphate-domain-containing protein n=1 Tax=Mycena citricolor TaxID=2018698 RepID=A0AAD2H572_9AGAR|nr:unnamed protein product [Mycena citricolor]